MFRKQAICVVVAVMMFGVAAGEEPQAAEPDGTETITIKGTTYSVVSDEQLEAMGFELPDLAAEQNAATYYLKAVEAYWSLEGHDELSVLRDEVLRHGWTDEAAPLAEYLEKNKETLALLEQAATMPGCRFPVLVSEAAPVNAATMSGALFPQLARMREFARLTLTVGRAREFEKRYADALEADMLALRIGNDVAQSPFLVSGLVGIACNRMGLGEIERCLVHYELDEETLTKAQKRIHALLEHAPDLTLAVRGERVFVMTDYMGAMTEQVRKDAREFWAAMDKALEMPLPDFIRSAVGDELAREAEARTSPPNVIALLGPALQRARVLYARNELSWTVLDVEFALARYAAKEGTHPATLDELKPFMLSDGIDPYSGERLKYRLEADGAFTIWSVGENLTDDGGRPGERHNPTRGDADHVWSSALIRGAN